MNLKPAHRKALWVLVVAACGCLGAVLVLPWLENRLLFHPTPHTEDWLGPPDPRVEDIALQSADGTPIHAWWLAPPGWEPAHGATLYSSGNAGNLSHRGDEIAEWQWEMGGAILIFDYPGYGRSEGSPSESGCYAAA